MKNTFWKSQDAFTLIELLITVLIIGVLLTIIVAQYRSMTEKSLEASTKANLATLRSALSTYYGDNEQHYPVDDLGSLSVQSRYIDKIPPIRTREHPGSTVVTTELVPTEVSGWSYNNTSTNALWGKLAVGCLHVDLRGEVWTTY